MEMYDNQRSHKRMDVGDRESNFFARSLDLEANNNKKLFSYIYEMIDSMDLPQHGTVAVADFGCSSSGPNAIATAEMLMQWMRRRYEVRDLDPEHGIVEFQAYFQDLHSTDFNSMIHFLTKASTDLVTPADDAAAAVHGHYFAAGIPGSLYGRVLPRSSLHVAFSFCALHWISKIPAALAEKHSAGFKGGASDAAVVAYAEQAHADLQEFLGARAEEIAPGGLMFLTFMVRSDNPPIHSNGHGLGLGAQTDVLNQLVSEGLMDPHLRDSLKGRIFCRTVQEAHDAVHSFRHVFQVEKYHLVPYPLSTWLREAADTSPENRTYANAPMGKDAMKVVRHRFRQILRRRISKEAVASEYAGKIFMVFYGLLRK